MNTNESKKQTNQAVSLDCLHVCAHSTLGNGGKPYIPPPAALSLSTVCLGNLRSLLCFLVSQLPQLGKRGTSSLVQATKSNNTWFLLFHNVQLFLNYHLCLAHLRNSIFNKNTSKALESDNQFIH